MINLTQYLVDCTSLSTILVIHLCRAQRSKRHNFKNTILDKLCHGDIYCPMSVKCFPKFPCALTVTQEQFGKWAVGRNDVSIPNTGIGIYTVFPSFPDTATGKFCRHKKAEHSSAWVLGHQKGEESSPTGHCSWFEQEKLMFAATAETRQTAQSQK